MKYDKIIAILWHWDPLTEQQISYDERLVEGDKGMLVMVQHFRPVEEIIEDFSKAARQLSANGQLIGLLHRDSLGVVVHRELYQALNKCIPDEATYQQEVFGGGGDYLYYDASMDIGLLNQEGDLVDDDNYEYYIKGAKERKLNGKIASVVIHEAEVIKVKKIYFEQVWTYYQLHAQRLIIECRNELLSYLALQKEHLGEGKKLKEILTDKQPSLLLKIETISGGSISAEQLNIIYNKAPGILAAYNALVEMLESATVTSSYTTTLREKFDNLIQAMPETI